MTKTLLLSSALALLMGSGLAYAGGNHTDLRQSGSGNSATIDQSGASGSDAGKPNVDTRNFKLWQVGSDNTLDIVQTGPSNQIGVNTSLGLSSENYTDSNGVHHASLNGIQDGTDNTATIHQYGGNIYQGNELGSFYQLGTGNGLTLTQQGTAHAGSVSVQNAIGEVYQNSTGVGNTLTVTQTSDSSGLPLAYGNAGFQRGNSIKLVKQDGSGDNGTVVQTGNRNYVATFTQSGDTDTASLTQNGVGNRVNLFSQSGGGNNTAKLDLEGNYNGSVEGSNEHVLGGPYGYAYQTASFSAAAGTAGVTQGTVQQLGDGNTLGSGGGSFLIQGNNNLFGFYQDSSGSSSGNTINGSGINGNGNQLAVSQSGNAANSATFNITGGYNELGVTQIGGGTLVATINGDNNNASSLGGFTGDALSAATSGSLIPGQIYQSGLGNSITLNVGDATTSSSNLFAFKQTGGDNNAIYGTIKGGNSNQVAVLQNGSGNLTSFTQIGSGNNIGVTQ